MVSPAGEVNPDELKGQSATGLVMLVVMMAFVSLVEREGPRLLLESTTSIFMEGLSTELGTAIAHMDGPGGAALFDHRCNAIELSDLGGAAEAIALGAKCHEQTGRQSRTRARQAAED